MREFCAVAPFKLVMGCLCGVEGNSYPPLTRSTSKVQLGDLGEYESQSQNSQSLKGSC